MSSDTYCVARHLALLVGLIALMFISSLARPQSQDVMVIGNTPVPTFKSQVKAVLVDVVVTDREGHPITGLQYDDFEIFENRKRQTIASFGEQRGDRGPAYVERPQLPPHFYTNLPINHPSGAINVLLLDALNTQFGDHATVRLQIIKYLQTIEPGPRLAIFTLGSQLRMVEGFTEDPRALIAALNHKQWGGTPKNSPMLRSSAQNDAEKGILSDMSITQDGQNIGASADAIADFERFLREMNTTENVNRMLGTLDALQMLSRYLSGFPGRKNLIWFSGSFPQNLFFTSSGGRGPGHLEIDDRTDAARKKTIDMLGAAQVAVYAIAAQGIEPPGMYQAQTKLPPMGSGNSVGEQIVNGQYESLNTEGVNRGINQDAADVIASETGGQAFHSTNGLTDAMAEVVHNGAYYYQLSYYPTDKKMIGRYRHIEVKIKNGAHVTPNRIAYRRGYYEGDERNENTRAKKADPLQALMRRGLPDATQLIFGLTLVPSSSQPAPGAPLIGDSNDLRGGVTRYSADFTVPVDGLVFDTDSDGVRHGNVELAMVASDHDGKPLNWIVRELHLTIKPQSYSSVQKTGIKLHEDFDVPNGCQSCYLRNGIYDLASSRAGTLEVPLSAMTAVEATPAKLLNTSSTETSSPAAISHASPAPVSPPASAPANDPSPESNASPGSSLSATSAIDELRQLAPADVPKYCNEVAGSQEHSSSLAKVCEFVLSLRRTLTNIVCDRKTVRYWSKPEFVAGYLVQSGRSEMITVNVTYRNGQEHYSDPLVNGRPVPANAPELSPHSTHGEFVTLLGGIFAPSSKPEFHYSKQTKLHSTPVLVFEFKVAAQNNRVYFLEARDKIRFPEYGGSIWVDARTSSLLRLQVETAHMRDYPIRLTKHEIDYSNVLLGDGTSMVLPTNSNVRICGAFLNGKSDDCSISMIEFKNWHKFRATTNIVVNPAN